MDTLKIIMEYLININYINIIYITENSPNISEKTENEVMDFLIKNYILTK
jgi:hypothetical protein